MLEVLASSSTEIDMGMLKVLGVWLLVIAVLAILGRIFSSGSQHSSSSGDSYKPSGDPGFGGDTGGGGCGHGCGSGCR